MADFSILTEVVPDLTFKTNEEIGKIWRDWMNNEAQDDIRWWLTRPLSTEERGEIQRRFACDWGKPGWWGGSSTGLYL
jgi:hypothetical protein